MPGKIIMEYPIDMKITSMIRLPLGSKVLSVTAGYQALYLNAIIPKDTTHMEYMRVIKIWVVENNQISGNPYGDTPEDIGDYTFLGSAKLSNPHSVSTLHVFYKDLGDRNA